MEEADNTFGLNTVELVGSTLVSEKKRVYKCGNGHTLELDSFSQPLYFSVHHGSKTLGTTNTLCGECIIDWANKNFTSEEIKSDG
jgi:hypothetical protein